MNANISNQSSGWVFGMEEVKGYSDQMMTDKEWDAYMKKIDAVEESIRQQIREEGEQNLAQADAERKERRENWQEQWEEFVANAKLSMKEVLQPDESDHELLIQEEGTGRFKTGAVSEKKNRRLLDSTVPYSQYMEGNTITYNGVVFQCDAERHAISLGDTRNPKQVITIPLADGGVLLVNRNEIGSLARAMGMFSPEDMGRILRAIAEDRQIHANQYTIEEEERRTMESLVSDTEGEDIREA